MISDETHGTVRQRFLAVFESMAERVATLTGRALTADELTRLSDRCAQRIQELEPVYGSKLSEATSVEEAVRVVEAWFADATREIRTLGMDS